MNEISIRDIGTILSLSNSHQQKRAKFGFIESNYKTSWIGGERGLIFVLFTMNEIWISNSKFHQRPKIPCKQYAKNEANMKLLSSLEMFTILTNIILFGHFLSYFPIRLYFMRFTLHCVLMICTIHAISIVSALHPIWKLCWFVGYKQQLFWLLFSNWIKPKIIIPR